VAFQIAADLEIRQTLMLSWRCAEGTAGPGSLARTCFGWHRPEGLRRTGWMRVWYLWRRKKGHNCLRRAVVATWICHP